jgi:hypothetical protein
VAIRYDRAVVTDTSERIVGAARSLSARLLTAFLSASLLVILALTAAAADVLYGMAWDRETPPFPRWGWYVLLAAVAGALWCAGSLGTMKLAAWVHGEPRRASAIRLGASTILGGALLGAGLAIVEILLVQRWGWFSGSGGHGFLPLLFIKAFLITVSAATWLGGFLAALVFGASSSGSPKAAVAEPYGG